MTAHAIPFDDRLDLVFQALANRTRRALIDRLARGPAMVTELAKPFGMSLNAISKHLIVLERAGLVRRTVEGRVHSCALEGAPLASAEEWLNIYRGYWTSKLDNFATFVETAEREVD